MFYLSIKINKTFKPILIILIILITLSSNALIDGEGNFYSRKFKLTFKKPPGNLNATQKAVYFDMPGVLVQYVNVIERITYTVIGIKTEKSMSFVGEYLRFHLSGQARNITVIEDNVWLMKNNAITLMQKYKCFVKKMMFYINVFIMRHKDDKQRKAVLMIASPHHHFSRLRREGYHAYLTLEFTD
jgi:hypothetical protein